MISKKPDLRDSLRKVAKETASGLSGSRTLDVDGQKVVVTRSENGSVIFRVPQLKKVYALMSNRLYERPWKVSEPDDRGLLLPSEEPETAKVVEQLNYKGGPEKVDTGVFKNKIVCKCGNTRWVKNADMFQVSKCKPCTYRDRIKRRRRSNN